MHLEKTKNRNTIARFVVRCFYSLMKPVIFLSGISNTLEQGQSFPDNKCFLVNHLDPFINIQCQSLTIGLSMKGGKKLSDGGKSCKLKVQLRGWLLQYMKISTSFMSHIVI